MFFATLESGLSRLQSQNGFRYFGIGVSLFQSRNGFRCFGICFKPLTKTKRLSALESASADSKDETVSVLWLRRKPIPKSKRSCTLESVGCRVQSVKVRALWNRSKADSKQKTCALWNLSNADYKDETRRYLESFSHTQLRANKIVLNLVSSILPKHNLSTRISIRK